MTALKVIILAAMSTIVASCSRQPSRNYNLNILISEYDTYAYDLNSQSYTINFSSKPPLTIKFSLTSDEKKQIIDSYYDLGLDQLSKQYHLIDTLWIQDECFVSESFSVTLTAVNGREKHSIQIAPDCDDFYLSNYRSANKVKKFLKVAYSILERKPQISRAPKTDKIFE